MCSRFSHPCGVCDATTGAGQRQYSLSGWTAISEHDLVVMSGHPSSFPFEQLRSVEGLYALDDKQTRVLRVKEGVLHSQRSGGGSNALVALGGDRFARGAIPGAFRSYARTCAGDALRRLAKSRPTSRRVRDAVHRRAPRSSGGWRRPRMPWRA